MVKVKLICIGKLKERALQQLMQEYSKRLQKYIELEIIELKECGGDSQRQEALEKESQLIESKLSALSRLVILDIQGKKLSSESFAEMLGQHKNFDSHLPLVFVIGGSYGVSEALKARSFLRLSFSDMTFSHQIFRVLFLEQLYRGYDILNHGKYHK